MIDNATRLSQDEWDQFRHVLGQEMVNTPYNAQFKKVRSQISHDWIPLDVVPDSSDLWPVSAKALIVQDKARIYETTNLVDFIVAKPKGNMKT